MIICHCTRISDHDINAAIDWMRTADPEVIITPGKIYHALGKKADCGGCMSLFLDTMRANDKLSVPAQLRNLRAGRTVSGSEEAPHEGRPEGYRLSQ
ncbi:BFD-like [2Fe-2S] binding domain protein [Tritonibacter multivorans]|uniref:BFD-like [2Fe-2S] binding domain protein n=1 Tax=Tritonibacter multivorans TaxID=928856 RepID=A0A0P1G2X6_9RHOB|nr:(2Fe-2S)-binding protein [Tritonibacter multivorans]MDA7419781.1 (2Fe-2S)-binding protein [Tritonibacter multivorans]CUH76163.1 BFD-like [2Fe-2S] binding domain protein [Tritonibacter multivorans]SFC54103.1 BFD-like [2Fe-2S] binding domain-containing protein [Tritonibacter multivorans]